MYYSDKPIDNSTEDLLDRHSFATLLANTLTTLQGTDTFTVGLFGKWGSGKTSIVNMALHELENRKLEENKEIIVVRFEPWHFSDSTELLSQFLIRLANEFKSKKDKRLKKIGNALDSYSSAFDLAKLIPGYGNIIAGVGKFGVKSIVKMIRNRDTSAEDILSQKKKVVSLLENQKNKILVVIDDIDRLSSEQIRQVFQLVSSVAKFPNTAYLLVFDKEIVVKALKKIQEGKGEDYLEKVIQMPIQIPEIQDEKLNAVLFKRLDEVISYFPNASFDVKHWQEIFAPCVFPFISNLRDINRLCNSLRFKLTTISSEVDFADMVAITAIEIGVPSVYEWIKFKKSMLTNTEMFWEYGPRKKSQQEWCEIYTNEFDKLLTESFDKRNSKLNTDVVLMAVAYLFPYFGQKIGKAYITVNDDLFRRKNMITHPEKFERYFYYDLDKIALKKSSIEEAVFNFSCDEFMSFLINEDENDRGITALKEIKAMMGEISPERAKILFKALISVTSKLKTIERKSILSVGASTHAEFLCLDLLDMVVDTERKNFLSEIIKDATFASISAISSFINMIELGYGRLSANGKEHGYKKVITLQELLQIENIFVEKVKKVLECNNLFENDDWRMILHLLESFDGEYAKNYLINALKKNENILSYLYLSVVLWTGAGNSYDVRDEYSDYLSKEKILEVIRDEVNSKNIFNLKKEIIERAAAFYLSDSGQLDWDGHISQEKVDETIALWKVEGIK